VHAYGYFVEVHIARRAVNRRNYALSLQRDVEGEFLARIVMRNPHHRVVVAACLGAKMNHYRHIFVRRKQRIGRRRASHLIGQVEVHVVKRRLSDVVNRQNGVRALVGDVVGNFKRKRIGAGTDGNVAEVYSSVGRIGPQIDDALALRNHSHRLFQRIAVAVNHHQRSFRRTNRFRGVFNLDDERNAARSCGGERAVGHGVQNFKLVGNVVFDIIKNIYVFGSGRINIKLFFRAASL